MLITAVFLFIFMGCGENDSGRKIPLKKPEIVRQAAVVADPRTLDEIVKAGELRVLMTKEPELPGLPREFGPHHYEMILLEKFAGQLNITLKVIYLNKFEDLIPSLVAGKGDVIAANMTATDERREKIDFSIPLQKVKEQIVAKKDRQFSSLKNFVGQEVVIEDGTCYWKNMRKLARKVLSLKLVAAPKGVDTEELLYRVDSGKIPFTVADSNYIESFKRYRPGIKVVYEFPGSSDIAWGIRKNSPELVKKMNLFLEKELPAYRKKILLGDLPEIRERKVLRVLTRNNPSCYFLHRGKLMGFEYELAREFTKRQGLQLVMVVPPEWNDLFTWLKQGRGDIIAAAVTITPKRKQMPGVKFCRPYSKVMEQIVTRRNDDSIKKFADLHNRKIHVREKSCYWETLKELQRRGVKFTLVAAPQNLETFEIIEKVGNGEYDLTLADDQILNTEMLRNYKVKPALTIARPRRYGWMVRGADNKLRAVIDDFFKKEYRGLVYNMTYKKYFKSAKVRGKYDETREKARSGYLISRFDPIIQENAGNYDFHWCLVASQIYQESRFDPKVRAWDGGMGLMQLMPATAKELGCRNPYDPNDNVNAGVKYMFRLRRRPDGKISEIDRVCFALASYNGGYGHLIDARRLADEMNLDPNRWNDNVEKSLSLLSKRKYYSRTRYGYCNSKIVTAYVREIINRYKHYRQEAEKHGKPK